MIEWLATDSVLTEKLAEPLLKLPVASVAVPSLRVTAPSGLIAPVAPVTVAVNVTDWPNTDGLADEVTTVDVSALLTV